MIPNILHQTWKTRDDLPEKFEFWKNSFFECNPGIEYRFYDDSDNRALLKTLFPELLPLYDGFPKEIFRVDMIRSVYLFSVGGVYADMDFQCLASLTGIFSGDAKVVLGKMGTDNTFPHSIPNAMMASEPNQAFWLGYLSNIEKAWLARKHLPNIEQRPEFVSGPVVLRETVRQYRQEPDNFKTDVFDFIKRHSLQVNPDSFFFDQIRILPSHIWYPLNWNDRIHRMFKMQVLKDQRLYTVAEARKFFPHSMAVTYWSHTWRPENMNNLHFTPSNNLA